MTTRPARGSWPPTVLPCPPPLPTPLLTPTEGKGRLTPIHRTTVTTNTITTITTTSLSFLTPTMLPLHHHHHHFLASPH
ncbi:hypothetical protein E2C01_020526 [Portunus trituberculatus]|uniref:Uncharacterized protein n=1 Tax=Portunus trituberculatus TaxID=210409 RepID=A0A5B7E2J0_PORTR|nr:hypothetical protein [Portunus trituberculatus]